VVKRQCSRDQADRDGEFIKVDMPATLTRPGRFKLGFPILSLATVHLNSFSLLPSEKIGIHIMDKQIAAVSSKKVWAPMEFMG
jgi:hypothetical protein